MLKTIRLALREVTADDAPAIHVLHSLPETDRYNTSGIPQSLQTTESLVAEWCAAQAESPRKRYVYFIQGPGEQFMGLMGITMGKPHYRNAEIWYKLHPQHWNQGFATEALKGVLRFCFLELGLHRVEAGCAVENVASIKVLEKTGFIREGRKRKILPIRGEWVDNFVYAILETDFMESRTSLHL
jgi:[ribosomal protein S5]-alanine N-acetyltransferase